MLGQQNSRWLPLSCQDDGFEKNAFLGFVPNLALFFYLGGDFTELFSS